MEPELRHKPVRYHEIDLLRFIAAMSVVLFHYTFRGYHADNMSPIEYKELGDIFKYGFFGVELFFIISGYVALMSAQGKTLSQYFISRVSRLYPAYWVACALCFLVVRLFGAAANTPGWSPKLDASLKVLPYNLTMLQRFFGVMDLDGVYWTLGYELVFYFLIGLLISFKWFDHLVLVLTVWLGYCALVGPIDNTLFGMLFFPNYAPYFIAGMVLFMIQTKQGKPWQLFSLLAASYLLAIRCLKNGVLDMTVGFKDTFSLPILVILLTISLGILLLIIYRKIKVGKAAWITWAGATTYPIYLLHHNIGYVIIQKMAGKIDKYVLLIGLIILTLVAAHFLHTLIERRYSKLFAQKLSQLLAYF